MRVFNFLMICGSLLFASVSLAGHNKKDNDRDDLEDYSAELTEAVQDLLELYEDSKWEDDDVIDAIEDLESASRKLEKKLDKGVGDARIRKAFKGVDEAFEDLSDEMEDIIEEIEDDCDKFKSRKCKIGKEIRNTFYDIEDIFADLEDEV